MEIERVAIGLSGGVDSSVAAALLLDAGYDVIGLTLVLRDNALKCVSESDAATAAQVAEYLSIPHRVIDAREKFDDLIVGHFTREYAGGRTPSPCVRCNPAIKFGVMLETARDLGCDYVATGHYVRKELDRAGRAHLLKAKAKSKDQSYFLQRLTQNQLSRTLLPLQDWGKDAVRAYARERDITTRLHSESQDLCFTDGDTYQDLVEKRQPQVAKEGVIVDPQGRKLGRHSGIHHFTIGQRRGTGVAAGERLYVARLDPQTNRVIMASREECLGKECIIRDVNWISGEAPSLDKTYTVKPRYRHPGANAHLLRQDSDALRIVFEEPQFALTPGQAAAIYSGRELLGGGWILEF